MRKALARKAAKPGAGSKPGRKPVAMDALDAYGLDKVCEAVSGGGTLTFVAADAGVSLTRLLAWIDANSERSVRVREARAATAKLWDERAEQEIREAADEFELRKARELAQHFRWRATKIAPREYGDKVQHANDPDNPMPAPQWIVQPVAPTPRQDSDA